jgi:hypothetical protein
MIQIPAYLQSEYDELSPAQQSKFAEIVMAHAAGSLGNIIITDMAFASAIKMVKNMDLGEES